MPMIGALARVDRENGDAIRALLNQIPGTETFELTDPGQVGLLIEAESLDAAHRVVTGDIPRVGGVEAVWPVYVNNEDQLPPDDERASGEEQA